MSIQNRLYNLLKEVNNHICPICQEYISSFEDCLILTCGHLYCKNCFLDFEKLYSHCSLCRETINHKRLYNCIEAGVQNFPPLDLFEIIYLHLYVHVIIGNLIEKSVCTMSWSDILEKCQLASTGSHFTKSQMESFLKMYSNNLFQKEISRHQTELLNTL